MSKKKYATKTAQVMDVDKRFILQSIYAPMRYLSRRKVVVFRIEKAIFVVGKRGSIFFKKRGRSHSGFNNMAYDRLMTG